VDRDEAGVRREVRFVDREFITSERKIADDGDAGIVGGEGALELDGVASEIDGSLDWLAVRADDFEVEFSGIALRKERDGEEKKHEIEK
jgi:hypothetical protein